MPVANLVATRNILWNTTQRMHDEGPSCAVLHSLTQGAACPGYYSHFCGDRVWHVQQNLTAPILNKTWENATLEDVLTTGASMGERYQQVGFSAVQSAWPVVLHFDNNVSFMQQPLLLAKL
eukprot:SAG22_NODE_1834_length_3469_cov_1.557864_2_plen_121_part_00